MGALPRLSPLLGVGRSAFVLAAMSEVQVWTPSRMSGTCESRGFHAWRVITDSNDQPTAVECFEFGCYDHITITSDTESIVTEPLVDAVVQGLSQPTHRGITV